MSLLNPDSGFADFVGCPALAIGLTHHIARFPVGFRESSDARVSGATFRPAPQALNLLGHGASQRNGLAYNSQNMCGCKLFSGVERVVKAANNRFFYFCATEVFGGVYQSIDIELS